MEELNREEMEVQTAAPWSLEDEKWLKLHKELVEDLRGVLVDSKGVRRGWIFGSVAAGTEREGSDVDVLVDMEEGGLMVQRKLREKLAEASGRKIDLFLLGDLEAERKVKPESAAGWKLRRRIK